MREANPFVFTPGIVRGLRPLPPAAEEEGIPGVPNFPSPGSFGIPSIYMDAMRPKAPLIILQEQVARGDGTTTLFTTANAYVTGFLEVFLNGVKQRKTTHYTETSPAAGTFTFVQAPKNNDYIDAIYGTLTFGDYCGLTFCDDTAFPGSSTGATSLASPPGPGAAAGPGRRVYVSGYDAISGQVFVIWVEDIYASPPSYQASTTGLPVDTTTTFAKIYLNPFEPSTSGWLAVQRGATLSDELYYNSNIRGGGSWSAVLNATIFNTVTGQAATAVAIYARHSDQDFPQIETTIATDGKIACLIKNITNNTFWLAVSTDRGTTWTITNLQSLLPGVHAAATRFAFVLGQKSGSLGYITGRSTDATSDIHIWKSTDLATWADVGEPFPNQGHISHALYLPYGENASEAIVLAWSNITPFRKSSDSGGTWADWSSGGIPLIDSPLEITKAEAGGIGIAVSTLGSATQYRSTDGGQSWSTSGGVWHTEGLALLTVGYYYMATSDPGVVISSDWTTFTDKTGNLLTLFADAICDGIVPDWTT